MMEPDKTVGTEKRPWHTPELRKNAINDSTNNGFPGAPSDAHALSDPS